MIDFKMLCVSKDLHTLTTAFITYVRPLLEYCCPVWFPCSLQYIHTYIRALLK